MTFTLRLAEPRDAEGMRDIYEPIVRDTAISFELEPPTADEFRERLARVSPVYPWLVAVREDFVGGYAYATRWRARAAYGWTAELSVNVHADTRGQGVGRALYLALCDILAAQGFTMAYGGVTLPNPASARLHESVGFTAVGAFKNAGFKHGRWHDVGWWQRELAPAEAEPRPAIPFAEFRDRPEVCQALEEAERQLRG